MKSALENTKEQAIKELSTIPGIGKSLATDLWNINIRSIAELRGKDPERLYDLSNAFAGVVQDRCVLYTFRCAVYFADTPRELREPERLKWWNWKDQKMKRK
ncbi:MAG TPA: helix-hairpin-helix domain-containing protein [Sphingobacteriaceae bacterium]